MSINRRVVSMGVFSIVVLSLFSFFVSAYAVGAPGDLTLYPGQVFDSGFDIMNTIGGDGDVSVSVEVSAGKEILSLSNGNRFDVPAGKLQNNA